MIQSTFKFESIGTAWIIDLYSEQKIELSDIEKKIHQEIARFSDVFSRFDKSSLVSKAANSGGEIIIPDEYLPLVKIYQKFYKITQGLFTPLIGNLLEDTGYDADYSLTPKSLRPVLKWEDVLNWNGKSLKLKKPAMLDFGAAGKGFLVDLIGALLEKENINYYCIDAGGDILYKNIEPIKVGLENPENINQVIGSVDILNESICGSAGNRRKWREYHHILNPDSLRPVNNILSVWVIAETGLLADALATALFFIKPEMLEKEFKFKYLILYPDRTIKSSKDFSDEIYYN